MLGINKVILIGTVGINPKTRYIKKGFSYSSFSLATNELVNSAIGKEIEETQWHEIVAYGELSEYVEKYVHKGDTLYVEGKIKSRLGNGSEGYKIKIYEIFADKINILARSKANESSPIPDNSNEEESDELGSAIPGFDIDNIPLAQKLNNNNLPL